MRKPAVYLCENKDADQLHGNKAADGQCLCIGNIDSMIPQLPKSEISSLKPSSVVVQPGLCRTWTESLKIFLTARLKLSLSCLTVNKSFEPRHEKTNALHMGKQRRRSALR